MFAHYRQFQSSVEIISTYRFWSNSLMSLVVMNFKWNKTIVYTFAECPLNLSGSNVTQAASLCSNKEDRGKCCRYINAFIAVSIAHYANVTSNLGVPSNLSDICLHSISQTLVLHGVPRNATAFCGFGTKIPVNYECKGRTTVTQMLQSPKFIDVMANCKVPLSEETKCKKCLNSGIVFLHRLLGTEDNITLSTCRDATFAALASQVDDASAIDMASCFFQIKGLNNILPGTDSSGCGGYFDLYWNRMWQIPCARFQLYYKTLWYRFV